MTKISMRFFLAFSVFVLSACQPSNVNFSDEYISQNKDKFIVVVPEVHELANIMLAISLVGQQDRNMIKMDGAYHQEVLRHFLPFRDHPVIDIINKQIKYGFKTLPKGDNEQIAESYKHYFAWKMNACGYIYADDENIIDDGVIHKMGFNYPDDPIRANAGLIEDFAKVSGFRRFYMKHSSYYKELINTYKALIPVDKMKVWLETKFLISYGSYRVIFSPLVNGAHSTRTFRDNGFEQAVMFISAARYNSKYNEALNEMRLSRVVFTEIDHNFVNPISSKYIEDINRIFADRSYWTNESNVGTNAYSTPYKVFNEYMTWALFSLYAIDNFEENDVQVFLISMEKQMVKERGFRQFDAFNQELIMAYANMPAESSIVSLFPVILEWAEKTVNS